MANPVTNTAQIQIMSTENTTQNSLVNRIITPSIDSILGGAIFYVATPDTAAHAISFPPNITIVKNFYIRNTGTNAQSLAVVWTPQGGASATIATLGPDDVLLYWQGSINSVAISNVFQGLTAITVQGNVAGITYEYFLGA